VKQKGLGRTVAHVLENGPDGGRVHGGYVQQLVLPGEATALGHEGLALGRRIVAIGRQPHVDDARDVRVRSGLALGGLAQVKDAPHIGRQPGRGLGVGGGKGQGAAAEHASCRQAAALDGAGVAEVDERPRRHKRRRLQRRREVVAGDFDQHVLCRQHLELRAREGRHV
jgi:hypothetical protein